MCRVTSSWDQAWQLLLKAAAWLAGCSATLLVCQQGEGAPQAALHVERRHACQLPPSPAHTHTHPPTHACVPPHLQVDPQASGARAQQVDEDVRGGPVEALNVDHALDAVGGAVQAPAPAGKGVGRDARVRWVGAGFGAEAKRCSCMRMQQCNVLLARQIRQDAAAGGVSAPQAASEGRHCNGAAGSRGCVAEVLNTQPSTKQSKPARATAWCSWCPDEGATPTPPWHFQGHRPPPPHPNYHTAHSIPLRPPLPRASQQSQHVPPACACTAHLYL